MASQEKLEKMQLRQSYRNVWHTDLVNTIQADTPYCCFAFWCGPCVSYLLRKRALYGDMSRYTCCAGYMPCSGRCGESRCPEFCLGTETQHKVEMDKRDGLFGPQPMSVPPVQNMSRLDQPYPPTVGYPPPGSTQPFGYPPPAQGYPPPAQGYPAPAAYPPPGYYPK